MNRNTAIAWAILALLVLVALFRYETFTYDGRTYKRDWVAGDTWLVDPLGEIPFGNGTQTWEAIRGKRSAITFLHYGAMLTVGVYLIWPSITKSRQRTDETEARSS